MAAHIIKKQSVLLLFFSILFFTPMRAIVIFICPFLVMKIANIFHLRHGSYWTMLWVCAVISALFAFVAQGNSLSNIILSLWIVMPMVFLTVADNKTVRCNITLAAFLSISTKVLLVMDLLGAFSYFILYGTKSEDAFGVPYGFYFLRVHGLALLNALYFFYYMSLIVVGKNKDRRTILLTIVFFLSFMLCFFGLGTILLLLTFAVVAILIFPIKKILVALVFCFIALLAIDKINPHFIDYTIGNIQMEDDDFSNRRKIQCFINYGEYFNENLPASIFGTGPGGFNSRVAFFLNNDANNIFVNTIGHSMPEFHKEYVYPLKNYIVTSFDEGTDGTRNQPFSSLISIFSEYGLLFGLLFYFVIIRDLYLCYKRIKKDYLYAFLFVSGIFFLLNLFTEQWLESSEYLFYLFFRLFVLSDINRKKESHDTQENSLLLVK